MKTTYRYTVYVADWGDRLYYTDRSAAWAAYARLTTEHAGVELRCDGALLASDGCL